MSVFKGAGVVFLGLALCMVVPRIAMASDQTVYDKPDVELPGRTIHAKVVKIADQDRATGTCDVSVENLQTGEVVQLHLDKTTERKQTDADPAVGDAVVVKYDENSKRALTFVKDVPQVP